MYVTTVSIILPTLAIGGAEKVLVDLANGLSSHHWRVQLITLSKTGPLAASLNAGVELVNLNCASYRKAVLALAQHFDVMRPEVVLTSLYATGLAVIAAKAIATHKPKVVIGAHNSLRAKVAQPDNVKDKYLLMPLCRLLFPWADAFIAVSKGVAGELQTTLRLPAGKVRVIYNPVVTRELVARASETVSHPWLVDPTGRVFKTIIAVGRLVEQKGFDVLLKAFARLRQDCDSRLIIVGGGPLLNELEQLAVKLEISEYVDFVGMQDNPQKFVSRANLFVLSSRWEGLGNVVIEAMACGCPVVATNCTYGPSEILEDGKYGALAAVDSSDDLACKMMDALTSIDPSHVDKATLRSRALEFSLEAAVDRYDRVLTDVCTAQV